MDQTVATFGVFGVLGGFTTIIAVLAVRLRRAKRILDGLRAPITQRIWDPSVYRAAARPSQPLTLADMQQFSARYRATGTPPLGVPIVSESHVPVPDLRRRA